MQETYTPRHIQRRLIPLRLKPTLIILEKKGYRLRLSKVVQVRSGKSSRKRWCTRNHRGLNRKATGCKLYNHCHGTDHCLRNRKGKVLLLIVSRSRLKPAWIWSILRFRTQGITRLRIWRVFHRHSWIDSFRKCQRIKNLIDKMWCLKDFSKYRLLH